MKELKFDEKQAISYCISNDLRDEQIKINLKKVTKRLEPDPVLKQDPIAIVCFGPSLKDTWEELHNFKYIMTCSGAHKFLIEKGIIPTWHVDLEPREHKIKMLGTPHKDVEYLIASTVHPRYFDQLQGYNTKLWHIFANDKEAVRILPKGEWTLTGGSSVGLRCMTIARFLGFTDLHIFGMDGNIRDEENGSHTTFHPNAPKEKFLTEYKGKKYFTTPSILHCAQETFHELDQMTDVKATFHGNSLVTAMSKDYKPSFKKKTNIAFNAPELISEEKRKLDWQLHQDNPTYGMGGSKHAGVVLKLSENLKTTKILDYGAGKQMLAKSLPFPIWSYDPAIPEIAQIPKPADIVICTDVLEHIEPEKLNYVLDDLKRCTIQIGYFVISTRNAVKTYANGKNTHSIVQGKDWWHKKLSKFFDIGSIIDKPETSELHIVVGPKTIKQPDMTVVEYKGTKIKFLTPNETTEWRAKTLLTKEPSTIEWIDSMEKDEILFDVGANIGSYSVFAGVKGVKVYSFEPEAENYALLVKNLVLNNITPNAYCVAISDKEQIGTLFAGQEGAGGACHSFNQPVGHDLQPRAVSFTQGCLGFPLDSFITRGLPSPHHLKIDVDGFEHNVINGAEHILANGLKSLLIEINPEIPEHNEIIEKLYKLGFEYDSAQVERATRKEGTFKGCAEYIFRKRKTTPLEKHLVKTIKNSEMMVNPFHYLYVEDVFPENIYKKILENMPENYEEIEKTRGLKGYPKRFTAKPTDEFWLNINKQLLSGHLKNAILKKFGIENETYTEDLLLIRDYPGYSIPPHTDTPSKVISALFYLPEDASFDNEGTCLYEPKDPYFMDRTGAHLNFEDFNPVFTAPFRPNSVLIFKRTDNSFHGVPPCSHIRNVLLYNIRVK